mmetsp:Transcript_11056/g.15330  ORF Transcript_11056/g.15330 Transcript_11056/m.15330 type:complete len:217 (+) Transcript_11056:336-986(+)
MRCPVQDSDAASLKDYFDKVVPFVDAARGKGHGVLIHCQQGVSRSSTITIAYLIKSQKMSLMDAYVTVKSKRPVVKPKKNFLRELQEYEKSMNKSVETKKEEGGTSKEVSGVETNSNRRKREDGLETDAKPSRPEESNGNTEKKRRIGPSCGPPPSLASTSLRDNIAAAAAAAASVNSNSIAAKKTQRKIGPSGPPPTATSTSKNKGRIGPSMPPK